MSSSDNAAAARVSPGEQPQPQPQPQQPQQQQQADQVAFLLRVANFAAFKHRDQRRKNALAHPYVNHPMSVAARLSGAGVVDVDVLAAALLHDTVEDTDTTGAELEALFGARVASIVAEVTDDKSQPKAVRKQRQIDHAPHCSHEAKLVKLADKLDNLSDLLTATPVAWTPARVEQYFAWSERVIQGLRNTNPALEAQLDQVLAKRHIAAQLAAKHAGDHNPDKTTATATATNGS